MKRLIVLLLALIVITANAQISTLPYGPYSWEGTDSIAGNVGYTTYTTRSIPGVQYSDPKPFVVFPYDDGTGREGNPYPFYYAHQRGATALSWFGTEGFTSNLVVLVDATHKVFEGDGELSFCVDLWMENIDCEGVRARGTFLTVFGDESAIYCMELTDGSFGSCPTFFVSPPHEPSMYGGPMRVSISLPSTLSNKVFSLRWEVSTTAYRSGQRTPRVTLSNIMISDGPVPIQLSRFIAVRVGTTVELGWTTTSEVNNYGFYIQRRNDTELAFVDVPNSFIPGYGTTIVPHDYSFTDLTATSGKWWYRLKQVDLDGTAHYLDAVSVDVLNGVVKEGLPTEYAVLQNYPNPFNSSTTICYALPKASHVKLEIYNSLGQLVGEIINGTQPAGNYCEIMNGINLPSGTYICRLQTESRISTKKLVLLK